jgi:hypothetical protein
LGLKREAGLKTPIVSPEELAEFGKRLRPLHLQDAVDFAGVRLNPFRLHDMAEELE